MAEHDEEAEEAEEETNRIETKRNETNRIESKRNETVHTNEDSREKQKRIFVLLRKIYAPNEYIHGLA